MNKLDKKKLILIVVLFAITVLLSWLPSFLYPVQDGKPGGYWNLGDVGVYLSAALLGGPWGALIAAVGAALADLIKSQAIYAPATLVIKAAMALLFGWHVRQGTTILHIAKSVGYCGLLMTLGYFLYDLILRGSYQIAAIGLPLNLLQVIASGLVAVPVLFLIGGKSYRQGNGFLPKEDTFSSGLSANGAGAAQTGNTRNLK